MSNSKIRIPIWENKVDYLPELEVLALNLLGFVDRDYQIRVWVNATLPEMDWYEEHALQFDEIIEYFKDRLRSGELKLSKEQIKAILRVHAMCWHFERHTDFRSGPEDWSEHQLFIIDQPYWQKIREKAAYALSLIRLPGE